MRSAGVCDSDSKRTLGWYQKILLNFKGHESLTRKLFDDSEGARRQKQKLHKKLSQE